MHDAVAVAVLAAMSRAAGVAVPRRSARPVLLRRPNQLSELLLSLVVGAVQVASI